MKKFIFLILFLFTISSSYAVVVVNGGNRNNYVSIDNSLQQELTLKEYKFKCKKCNKEFVIKNTLYHKNTNMYFHYARIKNTGGPYVYMLQPFSKAVCNECDKKTTLIAIGVAFGLFLIVGYSILYDF